MQLSGKRVLIFVGDDYEDLELQYPKYRLIEAGVLDDEQLVHARKDLATHEANFLGGDGVVREGGRLTEVGHKAIEAARSYMAEATRSAAA